MAGFETVVRPVVFPNIRPTARQSLPPQDDPDKGFAVIRGNPASALGVSLSWTLSVSQSIPTETQRTVDDVRVYQPGNHENYVDLQVPTEIKMDTGPKTGMQDWQFQPQRPSADIEIMNRGTVVK